MAVEIMTCPVCKQKLAAQSYVVVGTSVVCANPKCNTTLRIVSRNPIKAERIPEDELRNHESSPESYG